MTLRDNRLYIVVPCYNEEEVLPETARRLREKLDSLRKRGAVSPLSRILFVDDGSRDRTWPIIEALTAQHGDLAGLKLAHNAGHQYALLAGLSAAAGRADMTVTMDADLQDDVNALDAFVDEYLRGADVVYGVRAARDTDTPFKRITAEAFYRLMRLLGVDIVENHADYRLLSARALEALLRFDETDLFLRGVVPLLGFNSAVVPYTRQERFAGRSKYPLGKMLAFALDGIASFSVKPLRLIALLGLAVAAGSLLWALGLALCDDLEGLSALAASLWALGGVQLLCLGVVGEYVGRIYRQTKKRPRFIVEALSLKEDAHD